MIEKERGERFFLFALIHKIIRMRASDIPSAFSLHLTGTAAPTPRFFFQPFGFDISAFRIQSEDLVFFSPEMVACRTRILDYHMALAEVIKDDHLIFHFETSMQPGNIVKLLEQICWEYGFPTDELPYYVSGERTEILYNISSQIFLSFEIVVMHLQIL
jgi:hypothetical protein